MTRLNRRFFFYLLAAFFLLLAPLIIGYSLGYNFSFTQKLVTQTGGIFVKSKTPRLSLFLNNGFVKSTSLLSGGALLTDLSPGSYLIRMEKEGHVPWSKTAEVKPSIVTELRNVILFPRTIPYATSTREEISFIEKAGMPAKENLPEILKTINARIEGQRIVRQVGTTTQIIASQIHSLTAVGKDIFFVDTNGFLARLNPETTSIQTLGRPGFFLEKPLRFFPSPAKEIAVLDAAGGLYILYESDELIPIGGGIRNIHFDLRGNKALLLHENMIEVLWLKDNPLQPFQKRGVVEKILMLESEIQDAQWFYADNWHVVIQTEEGIFITELDGRGGRNTIELVEEETDALLTLPEKPNAVFFQRGKLWFKIEL